MIPIYRAKKIDSDEWVEGYLVGDCIDYTRGNEQSQDKYEEKEIEHYIMDCTQFCNDLIDPSTLAIHFPSILDKKGKKVFASLSKGGVGGDILLINDIKYNLYNFGDTQLEDYNEDEIGNSSDLEYGEYHRDCLSEVREDIEVIGIHK